MVHQQYHLLSSKVIPGTKVLKDTGDTGKAFEYSDFTPQQLADLKGATGDT